MNKKFLASVMAFSLLIPTTVFADQSVSYNSAVNGVEVSGNSAVEEADIQIDVPTNDDIVINPYMIEFDADKDDVSVSANGKHSTIISNAHALENKGNTPVAVTIEEFKVSGGAAVDEEKGAFPVTVIAGSAAKAKAKSINIYAAFAMTDGKTPIAITDLEKYADGSLGAAEKKLVKKVVATQDKKFTKKTNGSSVEYVPADLDGATGKAVVTIPAKTGVAYYQLLGDVNPNPTYTKKDGNKTVTVADPWTEADKDAVKVSYKLKFEPQQNTYDN